MTVFPSRPSVSDSTARLAEQSVGVVSNDDLPWHHFVLGLNTADEVIGTIGSWGFLNNTWLYHVVSWTTTNGAVISYDFYLAAGTWKALWFSDKRNDYGIQEFRIDGVALGAPVDHYAATRVKHVHTSDPFVVEEGLHRISRAVTGKNASSSNYLMTLSALLLMRTA